MSADAIPHHHSMATVCRMSRNIIFPPQFKTLHEWFHYAFANSEIDAVDRFPVLERDKEINTNSIERVRGTPGTASHPKLQDPNHNREVIFALPSLQLHFKTEHLQGVCTPDTTEEKPGVECSFITEFEDHIFVTVDADAFFFLHDLISSYLKEKEKVVMNQTARSASPNLGVSHMSSSANQQNPPNDLGGGGGGSQSNETKNVNGSAVNSSNHATAGLGTGNSNKDPDLLSVMNNKHVKINLDKVDLEQFVKDWRHFNCKTWHLEPTVRLLSWAGKSIEPYGIDYILNKLGFSHARTTIPKWLQRGFMDPLDKVEALLMIQLLSMIKENRNQTTDKN